MLNKLLLIISILFFQLTYGQYCTPSVTNNGLYIGYISFTYSGISGGVNSTTGNSGYSQYTGYSSGSVVTYKTFGLWITVYSSGSTSYNVKVFGDWNNDGDFDDDMEQVINKSGTVNGNLGFNAFFHVPLYAVAGDRRMRFVVTPSNATACGSISGEVEDYLITVGPNSAPVLNSSATTFINKVTTGQTDNDGISILEFVESCKPEETLITDANDNSASYSGQVPRGIAVYNTSAANGTWQYKVDTGAWTDFGSVSSSNALQLLANASDSRYKSNTRIRFVPSGTGTASFDYYAWDGSDDVSGTYANITSTGGTTAFSTDVSSASVTVVNPAAYTDDMFIGSEYGEIGIAKMDKSSGSVVSPDLILSGAADYAAIDIEMDKTNNKIYWLEGDYATIGYSDNDGSNFNSITPVNTNYWTTGIAIGGNKLYYIDGATGIVRMNLDGSNEEVISGGAGQLDPSDIGDIGDIEFYGSNLYFAYYSNNDGVYEIAKTDADGNNFSVVKTLSNYCYYLDVIDDVIYFVDSDGSYNSDLKKVSVSGGAVTTITSTTARNINGFSVDSYSSEIYYPEADANSSNSTQIRKVSVAGGSPSVVATYEKKINSLVFDGESAPLPVELTAFSAAAVDGGVKLTWQTKTEVNNYGFEIERTSTLPDEGGAGKGWETIGFIAGAGNSNSEIPYSFTDKNLVKGKYSYRLKQIDIDGSFKYSVIADVDFNAVLDFVLEQNYPNPFNPSTVIKYNIPADGFVSLKIFNLLGQQVASLVNKQQTSGKYEVKFDASELSSGMYIYRLTSGEFTSSHKMMLTK